MSADMLEAEKLPIAILIQPDAVVLTREQFDRLETLAARGMPVSDGTECTAGRPALGPIAPPLHSGELEFNGVPLSAMSDDRVIQSIYDVVAEAQRRGARGEVNITYSPASPVDNVEMIVVNRKV